MYLDHSQISCGIEELYDVGNNPKDNNYNYTMYYCQSAIVLASLTTNQKTALSFLKKKGFKIIHKPIKNPNSRNKIILLSKTITAAERKKNKLLKKSYVHDDEIDHDYKD